MDPVQFPFLLRTNQISIFRFPFLTDSVQRDSKENNFDFRIIGELTVCGNLVPSPETL